MKRRFVPVVARSLTLGCWLWLLCLGAVLPLRAAWDPVPPVNFTNLNLAMFTDQEIEVPYHLNHFAQVANAVVETGVDRGFLDIKVNREPVDNEPYNARIMEMQSALAYFYTADRPWNPYRGSQPVRDRLEAMLERWCNIQNQPGLADGDFDGLYSEYSPTGWGLAPTGFGVKNAALALDQIVASGLAFDTNILDNARASLRTALMALFTRSDMRSAARTYSNQFSGSYYAALIYLRIWPDATLQTAFTNAVAQAVAQDQSRGGWHYEQGGPDFGYSGVHEDNLDAALPLLWTWTNQLNQFQASETLWNQWLAANYAVQPGLSTRTFIINGGIDTRTSHSSQTPSERPWSQIVPQSRMLSYSGTEYTNYLVSRRAQVQGQWTNWGALVVPSSGSYTPSFVQEAVTNLFPWQPTDAQVADAYATLPYLATNRFTRFYHDGLPLTVTAIRRPLYHAWFNSERIRVPRQQYGLGLLWSDTFGTAMQSVAGTVSGWTWGTRENTRTNTYEYTNLFARISINGTNFNTRTAGISNLPPGNVTINYTLTGQGSKTLFFSDTGIVVSVIHTNGFKEMFPFAHASDAVATTTTNSLQLRRTNGAMCTLTITSPGAALIVSNATGFIGGMNRRLAIISATGSLTYVLTLTPAPVVPMTWIQPSITGSNLWSSNANWLGYIPPQRDATGIVSFFNTTNVLGAGTLTAVNNLGTYAVHQLNLRGTGTGAGASTAVLRGSAWQMVSATGAVPVVRLEATRSGTNALRYDVEHDVTLTTNVLVQGNGNAAFEFNGVLSGAAGLDKSGTAAITLAGSNTFTGPLALRGGTLAIPFDAALGAVPGAPTTDIIFGASSTWQVLGTLATHPNRLIVLSNAVTATVSVPAGSVMTLGGGISGAGALLKSDNGTLLLAASNSFSGGVTIGGTTTGGRVVAAHGQALGSGVVTVTGGSNPGDPDAVPVLVLTNNVVVGNALNFPSARGQLPDGNAPHVRSLGSNTLSGVLTLQNAGGNGINIESVSGLLTISGRFTNTMPSPTFARPMALWGDGDFLLTGRIENSANAQGVLVKDGSGTATWAGSNSVAGGVTVTNGTFAVNGYLGGGALVINAPAVLAGTGTVAAATSVSGTHQPGRQTFRGTLGYTALGRVAWELFGNTNLGPGVNFDQVVTTNLTITAGAAVNLIFDGPGSTVNFSNAFWAVSRTWTLFSGANGSGSFALGSVSLDSLGQSSGASGVFNLSSGGNAVTLTWTPTTPATVTVLAGTTPAEAGPVSGTFRVFRTGNTNTAITVAYTIAGTATPGSDFTAPSGSVVMGAGVTNATVTIPVLDDAVYDPAETVTLTLGLGSGYVVGAPDDATLTLTDNETLPVVTISASDAVASETGDPGAFDVSVSPVPQSSINVAMTYGGAANAGTDYTALPAVVTLGAGQSGTTLVVNAVADGVPEGGETVIATVGSGAGYTVGVASNATVTIEDTAQVSVTATTPLAFETGTNGVFTVTRSGAVGGLTVFYAVGGTALSGTDYGALSGSVTFTNGQSTAPVTVAPVSDGLLEVNETVALRLATNANYVLTSPTNATVWIISEDAQSVFTNTTTGVNLPWSTGGNWLGGVAPASGSNAVLSFFSGLSVASGTVTASNNLGSPFVTGSMALEGSGAGNVALVGGAVSFVSNALGAAELALTAGAAAYTVQMPVALGSTLEVTGNGAGSFTFQGVVGGAGGITKSGTSTLTLANTNVFAGVTRIDGGRLALTGGANRLPTNGTVTFGGSGGLDLGGSGLGLGQLSLSNAIYTAFVTNGSVTMSGANDLTIRPAPAVPLASNTVTRLDLRGLSAFTYVAPTRLLSVGVSVFAGNGMDWTLASGTNLITANQVNLSLGGNGAYPFNYGVMRLGQTNVFHIGNGTGTAFQLGGYRSGSNLITFQSGLVNPALRIRASNGTARAGNVMVGQGSSGTGGGDPIGSRFDLGVADVLVGDITLADTVQLGTGPSVDGTMTLAGGALNATRLVLGRMYTTNTVGSINAGTLTALFSQTGGTVRTPVLLLGDSVFGGGTPSGTFPCFLSTYELQGGSLFAQLIGGNPSNTLFRADSVRVVDWTAGTIRNFSDGAVTNDLTIAGAAGAGGRLTFDLNGVGLRTFLADAQRSITIAETVDLTGTGGFSKDGAGMLVLNNSNLFSGAVSVLAGTLEVNSSLPTGAVSVAGGAFLSGTGLVSGGVTVHGTLRPGGGGTPGVLDVAGVLSVTATGRVAWTLGGNTNAGAGVAAVTAGTVTATAGAAVDVILNGAGSTVDFADPFWSQSRTWTVIDGTGGSGTFSLGTVSLDSLGQSSAGFGSFSLTQAAGVVQVVWNPAVVVTLAATTPAASETGPAAGAFTVTRSGATNAALLVNYTVSGSATPVADYAALPGSVTIPAGQSSALVAVTPVDDGAYDPAETVAVTLTNGAGYTLGVPASGVVTIQDNDPATTVTIVATDAVAAEQGGNTGTFTMTLSPAPAVPVTVNLTYGGSAGAGTDYASLPASVAIAAGQTSTTLTVNAVADGVVEGAETVSAQIAAGSLYAVGVPSSAVVTIEDTPVISVTATTAAASEAGPTNGVFTVTRASSTLGALTVGYTVGGTAGSGSDFAALSGSVSFTNGQTTAQVVVVPVDDAVFDPAETVVLTLSSGAGYTLGSPASDTVTILDNDPATTVTIAATDAVAAELGGNTGMFTVTLTPAPAVPVTVNFAYSGTASAGADYTSLPASVVIAAGQASTNLVVSALADAAVEGAETVIAQVSPGTLYAVGSPSNATVTIEDSPTISVTATTPTAAESTLAPGTFTLTRAGNTSDVVTVDYTVTGGATAGADYAALSGTVNFGAGQVSAPVTVTPLDDALVETNETVVLTLAAGAGYALAAPTNAVVTVLSDDATYVFTNTLAAAVLPWSTAGNWQDGNTAASAPGSAVEFFTGQTLGAGVVTASNDVASPFVLSRLALNGAAGGSGVVHVTGGALQWVSGPGAGATLALNATNGAGSGGYNLALPMQLNDTVAVSGDGTAGFALSGAVSGSGGIDKTGTATFVLAGANSYAGGTVVRGGVLQVGNGGVAGSLGTGPITNQASLIFSHSGTNTIPGALSGTGTVTHAGSGRTVLSGPLTYTGLTTLSNGTLALSGSLLVSNAPVTFTGAGATLDFGGGTQVLTSLTVPVTQSNTATMAIVRNGAFTLAGSGDYLIGGAVTTNVTATLDMSGLATFDFARTNNSLSIQGGTYNVAGQRGRLVLAGTNTITGNTLSVGGQTGGDPSFSEGVLELGLTNRLHLQALHIGRTARSTGLVAFRSGLPGVPVVTLRGRSGGTSRVGSVVLTEQWGGGGISVGTLDFSGGYVDAMLGTVEVGRNTANGRTGAGAILIGAQGGILDATNLVLALGQGGTGTATGLVSQAAGTVRAQSLVLGLAESTNAARLTPVYDLNGGTLFAASLRTSGTGAFTATSSRVLNLNGGTLRNYDTNTDLTVSGTNLPGGLVSVAVLSSGTVHADSNRVITFQPTALLAGTGSVTKAGAGTWTLLGTNTATGALRVSAGTLLVNGRLAAGSVLTVSNGASLAGTGTVASATTLSGSLRPGTNGPGLLTQSGPLTIASTGRLVWELTGNTVSGPGTNFDRVAAGAVNCTTGAAVNVVLNGPGSAVRFTNGFWLQIRSWVVLTGTGITNTIALGTVSTDSIGTSAAGLGAFSITQSATAVTLTWTPGSGNLMAETPFQVWQTNYFGPDGTNLVDAADTSDPDGDGVANLMEYALGSDPMSAGLGAVPQLGGGPEGALWIDYAEMTTATDIVYQAQWTSDLTTWSTNGILREVLGTTGTVQQVRASVSTTNAPQMFLRLNVLHP